MNVKDVEKPSKSFEAPATFTSFMIQKKRSCEFAKVFKWYFSETKILCQVD